ncbi:MAG: SgcJ/EcaC family oxidoreductase [Reyranella sp.]|jgi:uncharacterized protein (TIGR02246 family)|nr:MAG: SgcJ/EcaC family oxidoreductase [Reyranella sp.]
MTDNSTPKDALAVVETWAHAFAASDVDTIVATYADDALFMGTSSKSLVKDRAGIRKYFEAALLSNRPRGAGLTDVESMALADGAVLVTGLDAVTGVRDGAKYTNPGRVTFVVARRGDGWKIAHFHRSAMPG